MHLPHFPLELLLLPYSLSSSFRSPHFRCFLIHCFNLWWASAGSSLRVLFIQTWKYLALLSAQKKSPHLFLGDEFRPLHRPAPRKWLESLRFNYRVWKMPHALNSQMFLKTRHHSQRIWLCLLCTIISQLISKPSRKPMNAQRGAIWGTSVKGLLIKVGAGSRKWQRWSRIPGWKVISPRPKELTVSVSRTHEKECSRRVKSSAKGGASLPRPKGGSSENRPPTSPCFSASSVSYQCYPGCSSRHKSKAWNLQGPGSQEHTAGQSRVESHLEKPCDESQELRGEASSFNDSLCSHAPFISSVPGYCEIAY